MGTTKKVTIELNECHYSALKGMSAATGHSPSKIMEDALRLFLEGMYDHEEEVKQTYNETFTKTLSKLGYRLKPENEYQWLFQYLGQPITQ